MYISIYIYLNHCAVHLKLTYYKSTILQLKNKYHATTTEAREPRARALQQREATAMRSPRTATKSSPRSPQLEKARAQQ